MNQPINYYPSKFIAEAVKCVNCTNAENENVCDHHSTVDCSANEVGGTKCSTTVLYMTLQLIYKIFVVSHFIKTFINTDFICS